MSKTTTIARMRRDGVLVRVNPDGSEEPMPIKPPQPMTREEVEQAARRSRQPAFTAAELATVKRIPRATTLRRALGLTREEFAARYRIPLGTLHEWEQGRSEPDQPARAYLTVIAHDPEGVRHAFQREPGGEKTQDEETKAINGTLSSLICASANCRHRHVPRDEGSGRVLCPRNAVGFAFPFDPPHALNLESRVAR